MQTNKRDNMHKARFFERAFSPVTIFLFKARSQSCPDAKQPVEPFRAAGRFASLSSLRSVFVRIALALLFVGLFTGCQNPSLTVNDLSELPRALTDGYNNERWYFNNTALRPPFEKQKRKNINGLSNGFFYPIRENLLVATYNGYLLTVNRIQLNGVHRIRLARGMAAPPAFYRPLALVAAEKGKYGLQAYDLLSRKVIWKKRGLFSRSSPLLAEKVVFHATLNGKIMAFNTLTGKQLWLFDSGMRVTANMAMHGDTLTVCSPDGLLLALDALHGDLLWRRKLARHFYASPMILHGNVYLPDLNGTLWALRLSDGTIRFRAEAGNAPVYQPCTTDGKRIYLMDSKGKAFCFTPDLKRVWLNSLTGVPMQPVVVTHDHLVVTTAQKYLYLLDKHSGKVVQKERLKHRADVVLPGDGQTLYLSVEYDHLEKWQTKGATKK